MSECPVWLDQAALPLCTNANTRSWLLERGSLTQRLREHWGDATVQLLDEGLATPLPHEAQRLGLAPQASAWVRCVLLVCRDKPRVYARTVIPHWRPHNPWAQVQRLGQQPLGELLFRLPDLQRSTFEWAPDHPWPHREHWQTPTAPATLARRCVFERAQAPLLLTEVFLDLGPHTVK